MATFQLFFFSRVGIRTYQHLYIASCDKNKYSSAPPLFSSEYVNLIEQFYGAVFRGPLKLSASKEREELSL